MKKFLIIAIVALFALSSCNSLSSYKCMEGVEKEYPNATKVKGIDNAKYHWLVYKEDGTIWHVQTMNQFNTRVSHREQIYPLKK